MKYKIKFSEAGKYEETVPVVRLDIIETETGESKLTGWLSFFRGYSFQVSMTREGHGDMGSTRPIYKRHILAVLDDGAAFALLNELSNAALFDFLNTSYGGKFAADGGVYMDTHVSDLIYKNDPDQYAVFIKSCIEFGRKVGF